MNPLEHAPDPIEARLEKSVEIGTLCAFYGGLLTSKQLEALRLYYDEDLSLGEIAGQFGVSRQNVHELLTRSVEKLRRYERALGGVKRARDLVGELKRLDSLLGRVYMDGLPPAATDALRDARERIACLIAQQEGEEMGNGI